MLKPFIHFFIPPASPKNNFTPKELKTKAEAHFRSPYPSHETEQLFIVSRKLIQELNETDSNFNKEFDKIIFGSLVIAIVFEGKTPKMPAYPKSIDELRTFCGLPPIQEVFYNYLASDINKREPDADTKKLILNTGEGVLNQSLPFDTAWLNLFYSLPLNKHVDLKQRYDSYLPQRFYSLTREKTFQST